MASAKHWIDKTFYPRHRDNWDDWLFRERILRHIRPGCTVLDLGAGAGIVEQMDFRGFGARICGVDLDPRVVDNPMLDEGRIADAGRIPYEDALFDVVFCDNVLEHLDEPLTVFREVCRILKPGGVFLFKTPNKWHYMPTIARATPHGFHQFVNRLRGRASVDTFPTRYRANTKGDVTRLAREAGLAVAEIERIEGRPEYLRMAAPLYLAGLAYERTVNAIGMLAPFRVLLVGTLRRP
ncbi:MAG: class I SAM-dependent methyltransferase [Hyphomicrobiaceae bacterium]